MNVPSDHHHKVVGSIFSSACSANLSYSTEFSGMELILQSTRQWCSLSRWLIEAISNSPIAAIFPIYNTCSRKFTSSLQQIWPTGPGGKIPRRSADLGGFPVRQCLASQLIRISYLFGRSDFAIVNKLIIDHLYTSHATSWSLQMYVYFGTAFATVHKLDNPTFICGLDKYVPSLIKVRLCIMLVAPMQCNVMKCNAMQSKWNAMQ